MTKKNSYFLTVSPILMWGIVAFFYGYEYFLQVSPSVMANEIMQDFQVNATSLGNLAACYFYTYALIQIPVGLLLDNFGARKLLTIASLLCAIGATLFGGTHSFAITILGRLAIGLGGAFAVVGCMYIAANFLPQKRFAFFNGILVTIGMIGAICGQTPLAALVNFIGWRHTMAFLGGIGIIVAILMWTFIRDRQQQPELNKQSVLPQNQISFFAGLKHVLSSKQSWLTTIYAALMFMPVSVFGSLWGVPFLMRKYNLHNTSASGIIVMLFVGLAISTPFFGWLSDYIGRRKPILSIGAIGALFCISAAIYLPNTSYLWAAISLFGFGFFTGGFLVAFAMIREIDPTNCPGTAMGFMNMFNMLGGAFIQPLVGWILDLCWDGTITNGIHLYSIKGYYIALALLPISILLALLILPWIKETYCQQLPPTLATNSTSTESNDAATTPDESYQKISEQLCARNYS